MADPAWRGVLDALDLSPRITAGAQTQYVGARRGWPLRLYWSAEACRLTVGWPGSAVLHLCQRSGRPGGRRTGDAVFDAAVLIGPEGPLHPLDHALRARILPLIAADIRLSESGAWWPLARPPSGIAAQVDAIIDVIAALDAPTDGPTLIARAASEPEPVAASARAALDADLRRLGPPAALAAALDTHQPAGWDRWLACLSPFEAQREHLARCPTPLAAATLRAFFGDVERADRASDLAALLLAGADEPGLAACWVPVLSERPALRHALFAAAPPAWRGWLAAVPLDHAGHTARLACLVAWDDVAAAPALLTALEQGAADRSTVERLIARLLSTHPARVPPACRAAAGWHAGIIAALDPRDWAPDELLAITPRTTDARLAWARQAARMPHPHFEQRLLSFLPGSDRPLLDATLQSLAGCASAASRPALRGLRHPLARTILRRLDPRGRLSPTAEQGGHLAASQRPPREQPD